MQPLYPTDLASFARRYQWRGGKVLSVRWRGATLRLCLAVRDTQVPIDQPRPRVRLVVELADVEEFRWHRRLNTNLHHLQHVRLAYFAGSYFIDLEPYDLGDDKPSPHDFRASSYYAAGRSLTYCVQPARQREAR
jgi:hypothetical protein